MFVKKVVPGTGSNFYWHKERTCSSLNYDSVDVFDAYPKMSPASIPFDICKDPKHGWIQKQPLNVDFVEDPYPEKMLSK
jgi:hypothetical protein